MATPRGTSRPLSSVRSARCRATTLLHEAANEADANTKDRLASLVAMHWTVYDWFIRTRMDKRKKPPLKLTAEQLNGVGDGADARQ